MGVVLEEDFGLKITKCSNISQAKHLNVYNRWEDFLIHRYPLCNNRHRSYSTNVLNFVRVQEVEIHLIHRTP